MMMMCSESDGRRGYVHMGMMLPMMDCMALALTLRYTLEVTSRPLIV